MLVCGIKCDYPNKVMAVALNSDYEFIICKMYIKAFSSWKKAITLLALTQKINKYRHKSMKSLAWKKNRVCLK